MGGAGRRHVRRLDRRGAPPGPPTTADLEYHISTLFPPVRPHGHLEVRYLDAQPGRRWALPAAVLAALLSDPAVTDRAREVCEPARGTVGARPRATALGDRVLQRAAVAVFELALAALPRLRRARRGSCGLTVIAGARVDAGLPGRPRPRPDLPPADDPATPAFRPAADDPEEARA